MSDILPLSASTFSGQIDGLFWQVTILMGISLFLSWIAIFYFLIRFRKKEGVKAQYIPGDTKKHFIVVLIPLCLFVLFDLSVDLATANVWSSIKQNLPEAKDKVRVIGQQWYWTFQHAGPDGQLDTTDDIEEQDLHLQVNEVVHFEFQSTDVLHSFSVPVFRFKQDIVPGRAIMGWVEPTIAGEWDVQCTEMCGIAHGDMASRVHVHTPDEYKEWLANPD